MSQVFKLADIGEGLEEAEIIAWLVAPGDTVKRDQPIVEVMTDKSNAELPSPCDGVVMSVNGQVGDILHVGETLAVIDDGSPTDAAKRDSTSPTADSNLQSDSVAPQWLEKPQSSEPANTEELASGDSSSDNSSSLSTTQAEGQQTSSEQGSSETGSSRRPKASPSTRRKALEAGVSLANISGTGPGGRILETDLERFLAAGASSEPASVPNQTSQLQATLSPPPVASTPTAVELHAAGQLQAVGTTALELPRHIALAREAAKLSEDRPLRGIRRAVSKNMTRAWSEIPHIHLFEEINAEPMMKLRKRLRASESGRFADLTPLSFFVAALASALRTYPLANATFDAENEVIRFNPTVNIGVAVASENGLVVPVIRDLADASLAEIGARIRHVVNAARTSSLEQQDFYGGTATITNFGSLRSTAAAPIIRPPEAVIVGFGSIEQRPFVVDGKVKAVDTMNVVLGADHRLLDGDVAAALINHICERLTDPIELLAER